MAPGGDGGDDLYMRMLTPNQGSRMVIIINVLVSDCCVICNQSLIELSLVAID